MNYFSPVPDLVHGLSFWYSLLFLIVRSYGVCLYSSSINVEARKPIGILRTLPSQTWCVEVIEFEFQGIKKLLLFYITAQSFSKSNCS